jgi:hypothetical protein
MKNFFVVLLSISSLFILADIYPQTSNEALDEAVEAQNEAIYSARFSPRWLIAYAEDLEARGYSTDDCVKIVEAAKAVMEVYKREISIEEKDAETKAKLLRYADAMLRLTDNMLRYYNTGDKDILQTIERNKEEVLSYEKE